MPLPSQTYLRPAAAASWRLPRGNGSGGGVRQRARRQRRARVSLCRQQRARTRRATADAAGAGAGVMGGGGSSQGGEFWRCRRAWASVGRARIGERSGWVPGWLGPALVSSRSLLCCPPLARPLLRPRRRFPAPRGHRSLRPLVMPVCSLSRPIQITSFSRHDSPAASTEHLSGPCSPLQAAMPRPRRDRLPLPPPYSRV